MQRSGKDDSTTRDRERERERQREEEGEERESVVNGCFRVVSDLFLSLGYLSFGEKERTGKERREGRKRQR